LFSVPRRLLVGGYGDEPRRGVRPDGLMVLRAHPQDHDRELGVSGPRLLDQRPHQGPADPAPAVLGRDEQPGELDLILLVIEPQLAVRERTRAVPDVQERLDVLGP
jgi:hypothetical protein